MESMHKIVGFLLGAAVGAVAVAAVVQLIEYNVRDQVPSEYNGWDHFAVITLGVPGALLAGYLARNTVKYFLILSTALLGSLVAMRSLANILLCAKVDSEVWQAHCTVCGHCRACRPWNLCTTLESA